MFRHALLVLAPGASAQLLNLDLGATVGLVGSVLDPVVDPLVDATQLDGLAEPLDPLLDGSALDPILDANPLGELGDLIPETPLDEVIPIGGTLDTVGNLAGDTDLTSLLEDPLAPLDLIPQDLDTALAALPVNLDGILNPSTGLPFDGDLAILDSVTGLLLNPQTGLPLLDTAGEVLSGLPVIGSGEGLPIDLLGSALPINILSELPGLELLDPLLGIVGSLPVLPDIIGLLPDLPAFINPVVEYDTPFNDAFSRWAKDLAGTTYCSFESANAANMAGFPVAGFEVTHTFFNEALNIYGFAGVADTFLAGLSTENDRKRVPVFSFRGSETTTAANTLLNLDGFPVPLQLVNGHQDKLVNKGFQAAYVSIRSEVLAAAASFERNPSLKFAQWYVTGHSLGGALATLAAVDLAHSTTLEMKHTPIVYTFGQPRVGTLAFARFYEQSVEATYRVVWQHDAVVHVGPFLMYAHAGPEVYFYWDLQQRTWVENQCNSPESLSCHMRSSVSPLLLPDHLIYYTDDVPYPETIAEGARSGGESLVFNRLSCGTGVIQSADRGEDADPVDPDAIESATGGSNIGLIAGLAAGGAVLGAGGLLAAREAKKRKKAQSAQAQMEAAV